LLEQGPLTPSRLHPSPRGLGSRQRTWNAGQGATKSRRQRPAPARQCVPALPIHRPTMRKQPLRRAPSRMVASLGSGWNGCPRMSSAFGSRRFRCRWAVAHRSDCTMSWRAVQQSTHVLERAGS
jgi:hypothetical protein